MSDLARQLHVLQAKWLAFADDLSLLHGDVARALRECAADVDALVRAASPPAPPEKPLAEREYLTPAQAVTLMVREQLKHAENYTKPDSGVLHFSILPHHLNVLLSEIESVAGGVQSAGLPREK